MDINNNALRRIHIIGSVGSGKTTLARFLSRQLNIPYYELDNVVWERHHPKDRRRTDEVRDELLKNILQSEAWIIEGAHFQQWVFASFKHADVIVFLDTHYTVRKYRIVKRFILQMLRLEKSNYRPSLQIFKNMFIWNRNFEANVKPKLLHRLEQEGACYITLKDNRNVDPIFRIKG